MQALTIALLTRHNDIPATESPAPKSPVSEPVTASGVDTVFTHAASAVCRHHHDADQMRTAAFAHLTCANAPLFPPCKTQLYGGMRSFSAATDETAIMVGKHKTRT